MRVLGIETSCDDTGVAIVDDGCRVLSNEVSSQLEHAHYGGIVPEIAARRHVEALPAMLDLALARAGCTAASLDGIAVTRGPGLIGSLLAGWCFGRGLAYARDLPLVGVHHLAAHVHGALMPALESGAAIAYPLLALVVSGGHTALYWCPREASFELLGQTRDDAAGEAFDKVAKLLELGFPGGPIIDRLASDGDAGAFELPRPSLAPDFSFSGLKTAVRRIALEQRLPPACPDDAHVRGLVASFQRAVVDVLCTGAEHALAARAAAGVVLCGGVAANRELRQRFETLTVERGLPLYLSPIELATDNGAMIAGAGDAQLSTGGRESLTAAARVAWPLGAPGARFFGGRGDATAC